MELTKEYIKQQKEEIKLNYITHRGWEEVPVIKNRYMALKKFCEGAKRILCVGSGGVEPIAIGATHAVDVHISAGDLLREQGWKGAFYVGSCDNLASNWSSKQCMFDVAVCSEVIEHLPKQQLHKYTV